jgi:hypothetical protein
MKGKESQDDFDDAGDPGEMAPQVVHVCTLPGWHSLQKPHSFTGSLSTLRRHFLTPRAPSSGKTHTSKIFIYIRAIQITAACLPFLLRMREVPSSKLE